MLITHLIPKNYKEKFDNMEKKHILDTQVKNNLITNEVIEKVVALRKNKKSPIKYLQQYYRCSEEEAEVFYSKVMNARIAISGDNCCNIFDQVSKNNKFTYSKEKDEYTVFLTNKDLPLTISGKAHRAIVENYSNVGKDFTTPENDICVLYGIPKVCFSEYKRIFGLTRSSIPLSNEVILDNTVDESIVEMLAKKKFNLSKQFEKQENDALKEDAKKWRDFEAKEVNPLQQFLSEWTPPTYIPIEAPSGSLKTTDNAPTFVTVLSDVHFGAKANKDKTSKGKGANTEDTVKCVNYYARRIHADVLNRKEGFDRCVVIANGDLCHTLNGFTDKGTPLKFDCLREEQFAYAFNSVKLFLESMLSIFDVVDVHSVQGNHSAFMDWVLFEALTAYFRTDTRIRISNHQRPYALFKVGKTLIVPWHGYHSEYHARLSANKVARENQFQNILLSHPEMLVGTSARIVVTSDQHHIEQKEFSQFHHIMTSSIIRDDEYADANGWRNRPSQQCFIIDDDGLKETLNYYFS